MTRSRMRARPDRRRGAAAVEMAITLPLIMTMLIGLWEVGRVIEVQQILFNAAREGARQAATGQYSNAQVEQITLSYLKIGLGDTSGKMTSSAVVTVADLTHPGTDSSAATTLDQLQVTISVPFQSVRWSALSLVTTSMTVLTNQASWLCLVDLTYPLTTPQPPTG